jgi:hypothetical protein
MLVPLNTHCMTQLVVSWTLWRAFPFAGYLWVITNHADTRVTSDKTLFSVTYYYYYFIFLNISSFGLLWV